MIFQSLPLGDSFQQCGFLGCRRIPRAWAEVFLHPWNASLQTVSNQELPSLLIEPLRSYSILQGQVSKAVNKIWAASLENSDLERSCYNTVQRSPLGKEKVACFVLFIFCQLRGYSFSTARGRAGKSWWHTAELLLCLGFLYMHLRWFAKLVQEAFC